MFSGVRRNMVKRGQFRKTTAIFTFVVVTGWLAWWCERRKRLYEAKLYRMKYDGLVGALVNNAYETPVGRSAQP